MKKLIAILICLVMCLLTVGCNNTEKQNNEAKAAFQQVLEKKNNFSYKCLVFDKVTEENLKEFFLLSGRQKFAENEIPFNRNGVINVVGFLKNNYPQLFSEQRNTEIALVVEASKKHPIRQQFGCNNLSKNKMECVKKIYNEIFK